MKKPNLNRSRLVLPRRDFLQGIALGAGLAAGGLPLLASPAPKPEYRGPNVVIVRFGGGVRRRETIDPKHTYSPYVCHELTKRGVLFPLMEISEFASEPHVEANKLDTSHGQGTLYILTGKYERFKDVGDKFLGQRFESSVPTVFEYLRKQFEVPEHQTLIINGEDRTDEEFYSFSNHHLFGAHFRSNVLSLYRFKTYLLRQQLHAGKWEGKALDERRKDLAKLESLDYRTDATGQGPEINEFWERWRRYYGETGLVNPRGDRLLTELATRAIKELRPKLMMINYNDPDYVHWGYMSHYTRGISVMDEGVRQLVATVEADPEYRDNTVFVIVPDCGRDSNPYADVPCQHHFNSKSAHEIFALMFGPGIERGVKVDKLVNQVSIAATVGKITGAGAEFAEGPVLEQAFA
jgi:hypothetical protein